MKKTIGTIFTLLLLVSYALAGPPVGGGGGTGASVTLDTTNFDGQLSGSDTTVQTMAETIDEISAGGDEVQVDSGATVNPDFQDGGDINFTNTSNVITATLKDDVVAAAEMADADHGDVAWSGGVAEVQAITASDSGDSGTFYFPMVSSATGTVTIQTDTYSYFNAGTNTLTTGILRSRDSNPAFMFLDDDAPGADKDIANIIAVYVDGGDGAENADVSIRATKGGVEDTVIAHYDESQDQWELPESLEITGDVIFPEKADHTFTPSAGYSGLWVRNDTPSALIYTDDAGTDHDLTDAGGGNVSDNTAEAITGVWEIQDDTLFNFGNDADFGIRYDETTDDQLEIVSNSATDTTIDINNAGAGATNLVVDGTITAEAIITQATADPIMELNDSDAAGADADDEEAARFYANMITTTEDSEDSDWWITAMQGGTRTTTLMFDESQDQLETAFSFEITGDIILPEKADHTSTPGAGFGYLWVRSDTPSSLIFTDDAGTDTDLTAAASGDVTDVGDCASGACLDGSSDGGTYIRIYDGDSHYLEINPGDLTANRSVAFRDAAGTVLISGDTLTGDVTATFDTDGSTATTIQSNAVDSSMINTIVDSVAWDAGGMTPDGTQCADAARVTINSGPVQYTIICADNDASTMYGHIVMPDSWDGGTVTFEGEYLQTAADTSALNSDVTMMCRGATETVNNTWGTEVALDDAAVTGSNGVDHTTTAAITPNGTCAGGDTLYWRWQLDATGTTTAVATLHFLGAKIEYTSNVGD